MPGSDIDLLLILNASEETFLKRIPRFLPSRFPVRVDVFPYTEEEVEKMKGEGNFFIRRALEEKGEWRFFEYADFIPYSPLRLIGMHNARPLKLLVTEQDQIISDSSDFGQTFSHFFH